METATTATNTAGLVWQKSKWIIKGCIVGLMAILFMIPMIYVKELVIEREKRQRQVTHEISSKWAGPQNIAGPVLCIPYVLTGVNNEGKPYTTQHIASFLPDVLTITSDVKPTEKHRGIFKVMLYNTRTNLTGSFGKLPLEKMGIAADKFQWDKAYLKINLSDIKGLNESIKLKWKDSTVELSPANVSNSKDGLSAAVPAESIDDLQHISFSADIDLNGSEKFLFTPLGKSTTVTLNSEWKDPSFNGNILPQSTEVSATGFTATWKNMAHTRSFPQQWTDNDFKADADVPVVSNTDLDRFDGEYLLPSATGSNLSSTTTSSAAFGVNLFIPVNGYQKTLRTVKYAILCILLTFAAFFLIETVHKKSAHPFQYGLVGLALVLFYTLLLSFSEYTGFNTAYIIASLATVSLIGWFVKGILKSAKPSILLSVVLVLIYSYVFSLLQLQDYALLFGSIGLFLTLAVIMYFSRKISW